MNIFRETVKIIKIARNMFLRNSCGNAHESFTKDSGNFPEIYGNLPEARESIRTASGIKPDASGTTHSASGTKPCASGDRKGVKAADGPRPASTTIDADGASSVGGPPQFSDEELIGSLSFLRGRLVGVARCYQY